MPLFNLQGEALTGMPHQKEYDRWRQNLSDDDYKGVIDAIHDALDTARDNGAPLYSSRLPGSNWANTPYMPIYLACKKDELVAKLFYGQLCWEAVQSHEDDWTVINESRDDDSIGGKIYFIKK